LIALLADAVSSDARAVGLAAEARGVRVHTVHEDLTEVYCGQLAPQWRRSGPAAVGGLTRVAPLFYLERLAWDAGMRVVLLGRHEISRDGLGHAMRGPQGTIDAFEGSARLIDWRIALAHTLTEMPLASPALHPVSAVRNAVVAGDRALFSWVLAPVTGGAEVRT
jgi:hypothetical protein